MAPDVYVLPGVAPGTRIRSWKIWEKGLAPSFALEVVSRDWKKDYQEAPERYGQAGVDELLVFDPSWQERPRGAGVRWQVFRRGERRRREASGADRVRSRTLGCWLRVVGSGDGMRLRIGHGPAGADLFPTAEEAALAAKEQAQAGEEQQRAAKEAERAAKEQAQAGEEQQRAAKEAALAAKEAALARIAVLEAQLAELSRKDSK